MVPGGPELAPGIGEMLISSRSMAEYRAMFALTSDDLRSTILDCPGGTSSFTAEANADGGRVVACDIVYGIQDVDGLERRALSETDRGARYVRAHPDEYRWTFFSAPSEHRRSRRAAGRRFAADRRRHPEHYVAGRLPHLPFVDRAFDLVLSSHLLFSYADRLNFSDHLDMILELGRVAQREVRVFPLVPMGSSAREPRLPQLLQELDRRGVVARVVDVDYEFQAGGRHMLVCRPRARRPQPIGDVGCASSPSDDPISGE